MPRISEVSGKFLREIIVPEKSFAEIMDALIIEGKKIADEIASDEDYESFEAFIEACKNGKCALTKLEGRSVILGNKFILQACPMGVVLDCAKVDGKLPEHFTEFLNEYKRINPENAGVFHPGCIIHQFVRQQIIGNIKIKGESLLNYYQLGCGSRSSGKVVYDQYGTKTVGSSQEEIDALLEKGINTKACLYAVVQKK